MLVDRLSDKPSDFLRRAREKYVKQNPMSMKKIDDEIESCRSNAVCIGIGKEGISCAD